MGRLGQAIEIQAFTVGSIVASSYGELDLDPAASHRMAGLNGLDTIGPFHGEANVRQVKKFHVSKIMAAQKGAHNNSDGFAFEVPRRVAPESARDQRAS
jgi:hypothetical protein